MNAILNNSNSEGSAAAGEAGGLAPEVGGAPGQAGAPPAAEPKSGGLESAFQRAQERLRAKTSASTELAAGDAAGASTPANGAGETKTGQTTETTSADQAADTVAADATGDAGNRDSTVAAPQHWPEDIKAQFEKVPEEGRGLVLDLYKGMQRAFTQGQQAIKQRETELGELVTLEQQFQKDPKGVLAKLAQDAGVEVFFERPLPEGEIPTFENAADMAKWVAEQTQRQVEAKLRAEREEADRSANLERSKAEFRRELEATAGKYKDFADHREGVMAALSETPELSVENAYRLATYDGLFRLAQEGQQAKAELEQLKAQMKKQASTAMRPDVGAGNGEAVSDAEQKLSPLERAHLKAQRKLNAQRQTA